MLAGLSLEERSMVLDLIAKLRTQVLTKEKILELDETETFPADIIRDLLSPEIGLQLLFIPEEFGGMGGGARDIAAISEEMAKICLGVSTAFLAIHLGTDPILVGGTPEQKERWLGEIAEGRIVAYAVTEPEAGSNLASFKTTAQPVADDSGQVTAYRINGNKQFISNGSFADLYTVLAQTPEGPSFFVVERGTEGFTPGKPEMKHGIRCSNTSALTFEDVMVPADHLIGGVPGKGLAQANEVFGYTRLMVAAFGLGAGVSALEQVIEYSRQRSQFGSLLWEKQGYTHKLILPHWVRLEAARAYIEEVAERLDSGEQDLQVEGSIAKLFATETGNACAEDAIQAMGGYGYTKEYEVEKIKRDVKITTIYEGTSEIQQMIISTYRWRNTVKSKGGFYQERVDELDAIHRDLPDCGAQQVAQAADALNKIVFAVHKGRLTKQQHVMFDLADVITEVEVALAMVRKVQRFADQPSDYLERLKTISRLFAGRVTETCYRKLGRIVFGSGAWEAEEARNLFATLNIDSEAGWRGYLADMGHLAALL